MAGLLEYVRALAKLDSRERGDFVLAELRSMGASPGFQSTRFPRIRNVIVDSSPPKTKRLVFSAHYDRVKGSPGANDNASGVAVLLGLCSHLKDLLAPVRVIFFDREEAWLRTPFLKLGLLGSLRYAFGQSLRDMSAVYNVEYAGMGDALGIWPVKPRQVNLGTVLTAQEAATKLGISCGVAHIPWLLMSSDHLSFRLKGFANAVTLSLMPSADIPALEQFTRQLSVGRLLARGRPRLPEPLAHIHSPRDTSDRLNEESLQLMLKVLIEITRTQNL